MSQMKTFNGLEIVDATAREQMITKPPTAQVGQMLVVKAVDENGVPTEWEVTDVASGGDKNQLILDFALEEEVSSANIYLTDEQKEVFNNSKELYFVVKTVPPSDENITSTGYIKFELHAKGGYGAGQLIPQSNNGVNAYGGADKKFFVYVIRGCTTNKSDRTYIYRPTTLSYFGFDSSSQLIYDKSIHYFMLRTNTKFGVGTSVKIYARGEMNYEDI